MNTKSMQQWWESSYLSGGSEAYLEELYEDYLKNPEGIDPNWRGYFDEIARQNQDVSHQDIRNYFANLAKQKKSLVISGISVGHERKQEKVIELIDAYRSFGHLQANIDPLGLYKGTPNEALKLEYYGFTEADLATTFDVGTFLGLPQSATLNEIYQTLQKTYCRTIGFEYRHINRFEEVAWLQQRIEQQWLQFSPTKNQKLRILDRLVVADGLEKYLGFKYVGQKRFSLEGGDSLIPMLDEMVNRGAESGLKEIAIGMAHRGRLNVLVNIVGKEAAQIFSGFEGKNIDESNSGDVKYHLGYSSDVKTPYGAVHLMLAFNPSHLEIVSPVVQGSVRARQRRRRDTDKKLVMPIQIHGDAAFAGQGVVMETFSMSQTRWFTVGGSVHIVINNQVGFTTSNPKDARSTLYCTDVAKIVEAPILHVNGNDPEAAFFAAQLAIDYREKFKRDIVIDLVCYRRHGHNEADEPSATQPIMYKVIKALSPTCHLYAEKLIKENVIDSNQEKILADNYRNALDQNKPVVETLNGDSTYEYNANWEPFQNKEWNQKTKTAVPAKQLQAIAKQLDIIPKNFAVQPQVKKMLEAREKMTLGEMPINWGYAEVLAYATLLNEGYPIRLCGQDVSRGTFSHRHAVLHDQNTDEIYIPLSHISDKQAHINFVDSLLSEEAVLAFEYGYATAEPNMLDIWEAQFGDFANGAQVVIDQFISSGEQKWKRYCGLVMLLPHGYEGQGPEHSSARLERYLQLCAQDNMQVCMPTTPAQIFHLLRRQMVRPYRKPLIVMTPKSMLRHHRAVSEWNELTDGEFQLVIPDTESNTKKIDRVVLTSGKVYYDLIEKREAEKLSNVAIIRIEQLYPFPDEALKKILQPYAHAKKIIWCQEEPQNQGAWLFVRDYLEKHLAANQTLTYAGRPAAASPAVGYHSVHEKQQKKLVEEALL